MRGTLLMASSLHSKLRCVFALLFAVACHEAPPPVPHVPPSPHLPSLSEVELAIPESEMPVGEFSSLALTLEGSIIYPPDRDRDPVLTTIDSTGAVIARWGRRGEGPGELIGDEFLLSGDSIVVAASWDGHSVRVYTPSGDLLSQRPRPPLGYPSDLSHGMIAWWQSLKIADGPYPASTAPKRAPLLRWCIWESCEAELLPADDTILGQVHEAATPILHGMWPAFGLDGERFALGNGYDYTLWLHESAADTAPRRFGRKLPPRMAHEALIARQEAGWSELEKRGMPGPGGQRVSPNFDREREFLRTVPMPHFQYGGIKFDGKHRMWVIGRTGDSTFFDIFANTTFLGRHVVDCRRFNRAVALRGHWVALGCLSYDETETPVIRLFRIVEPTD